MHVVFQSSSFLSLFKNTPVAFSKLLLSLSHHFLEIAFFLPGKSFHNSDFFLTIFEIQHRKVFQNQPPLFERKYRTVSS